jgi:hypothetical protein
MASTINRELTIELLRCISVELPPKSKLPDTELEKRLSKTLDGCQYLARVVPTIPLNPSSYKPWNEKTNQSVFDAVDRQNLGRRASYSTDRRRGTSTLIRCI